MIDTIAKNQGLFGIVSAGAEIRNVTLDATCSVKVRQAGYAAGIAAGTNGTGLVVIENCGNEANITAEGPNAAGILGVNYGATVLLRISNCYNTGTITGTEESAGISGWLGSSAELTNCYNVGKVKGIDGDKTFARFATDPIFNNCYETVGKQVTKVTDEDVVNGGLCYALNDSVSGGEVFFQTLGTDNHPVLFKNHQKVFEINGKFTNDIVGIKDIANDIKHGDKVRIYSTDGILLPGLQKGINIVRKADGTTQKVFVK